MVEKQVTSAEKWETFYNKNQVPWDDPPKAKEELIHIIEEYSISPCTTLDIGCGTGIASIELSKMGFEVTGIDISPTAIKLANTRSDGICEFEVFDIFNFYKKSLNKKFDFIFDIGCFHYTLDFRFVEIVAQYLNPNGIWYSLIGSVEEPHGYGKRMPPTDKEIPLVPPAHSIQDITTAVNKRFEIILIRTFNPDDGYSFWSCLMRKRKENKND